MHRCFSSGGVTSAKLGLWHIACIWIDQQNTVTEAIKHQCNVGGIPAPLLATALGHMMNSQSHHECMLYSVTAIAPYHLSFRLLPLTTCDQASKADRRRCTAAIVPDVIYTTGANKQRGFHLPLWALIFVNMPRCSHGLLEAASSPYRAAEVRSCNSE